MTARHSFVVGWLTCLFFHSPTIFAQNIELKDLVAEVIQKMSASTVVAHKGSMDFVVDKIHVTGPIRFIGRIRWDFPDIRWDFEEEHFDDQGKIRVKVSKVLIDSPNEIITINKTERHAFRSVQHARGYEAGLRIAPWQIWTEFDDMSFSELLDVDKIQSTDRQLQGRVKGKSYFFELTGVSGKAKGFLKFDFETGLPIDVWCTGSGPGVGQKIEWLEKDGISFPLRAEYTRLRSGVGKPHLKLTTSGHSRQSSLTPEDCSMKSIKRADVDLLTTFRPGQKAVTSKFSHEKSSAVEMVATLKRLGREEGGNGFARKRD